MFSRFFIDRPVFATVISLVIVLAGLVARQTLPVAQYPEVTPPTVTVTALYPGANARTVQDTVAAPIEAQVTGVEGMLYMSSHCTNDGAYKLTVTFKHGTNADMAQVLVYNRVSLALPLIPPLVQNEVISVKKMSPNTLMIVNLVSPDNRYDSIFLSNYATIHVKDELNNVEGVAGITYLGQRDYSLRAWLDPQKMAALNLSGMDVVAAIAQQNVQVAAGQIGQPPTTRAQQFQLTINTQGRLTDRAQFADVIIKAGRNLAGQSFAPPAPAQQPQATPIIRLRDVVRADRFFFRIELDLDKVKAHGLTLDHIKSAIQPAPQLVAPDTERKPSTPNTLPWQVVFTGAALPSAAQIAATRLVAPSGKSIALRDVVAPDGIEHLRSKDEEGVQLGSQQYDQSCTLNGKPSVALSIYQQPGSNALETAAGIYAKMKELEKRFPAGMEYRIVYDTTPFIRESVVEVFNTLRDAVILVAIVVLLFLQDWRAMILPMIDVPVSLIGTFAVMAALGFTLNNLTLFGLVLAIGIVVDDAIVVLENIERQMATGLNARDATVKAMDEITGPILAITLVLSAVFIPCCFLSGLTGQFFRQFAVTIAVSTIISAINAITMTPSRAVLIFRTEKVSGGAGGHQLKREAIPWWFLGIVGGLITRWAAPDLLANFSGLPAHADDGSQYSTRWWLRFGLDFLPGLPLGLLAGWILITPINRVLGAFFHTFNRAFDRLTDAYGLAVGRVLRLSTIVCLAYVGLLILTGVQFVRAPAGFIPQQDKGYIILTLQLRDASSVDRTEEVMAEVEKIARGDDADRETYPGIDGVADTVGVSGQSVILGANSPNLGSMYVMLQPFDKRRGRHADDIARALRDACLAAGIDATVATFGGPPVDGLGTTGGFKVILEDRANLGDKELQRVADQIVELGNDTERTGLQELGHSSRAHTPWLYLEIDRVKCMTYGLGINDVFNTLQVYLGSYYINNFNAFNRTWQVNIQADQKFRDNVDAIAQLEVRNNQGRMVRLGSFMDIRDTVGPALTMRYNGYAAVAITGNTAPGVSSGQAIQRVEAIAERTLPRSMMLEWTELNFLQLEAGNKAMFVFLLAVMFVFLVLAAQYESWSLPLAVILVVPMCLLFSISGVVMAAMEVNIFTQIGFVVLVGLASKNAILIVEFAKVRREQGEDIRHATIEASRLRLRPILMTSFAFILGVVPLVLATGAGHEMRQSLGLAVFAGMCGVTLFGIFLTPAFYYVIQRLAGEQSMSPPLAAAPAAAPTLPMEDSGDHGSL